MTALKLNKFKALSEQELDDILQSKNLITKEELDDIDKKWKLVAENFLNSKKKIGNLVEQWRSQNKVGVNEFSRLLDMSPRHYYRIIAEDGNITIKTLAEIAGTMGKKLRIEFDD